MFVILGILLGLGATFGSPVERVFGGENAAAKEFPFAVALVDANAVNISAFCTGTILTKDWVLTAAQCCINRNETEINLVASTVNLSMGGKVLAVNKTIVHPFYDSQQAKLTNDVCLIQLKKSLVFSEKVQPVTLTPADYPYADKTPVSVLGWGFESTSWGGNQPSSNKLQVFRSLLAYPSKAFVGQTVSESTYAGHSPCQNDEGAPLIFYGTQRPVLIGIFSYIDNKYCSDNLRSTYGRLAHYMPWIQAAVGSSIKELVVADYKELPCRFNYCSPW